MRINSDYRDLSRFFGEGGVRYPIVGWYAVMKYTEPYTTKDIDLWLEPTRENAERAFKALAQFGTPLEGVQPKDLIDPELIYQIGVPPSRVDIIGGVAGLDFAAAWERRETFDFESLQAPVVCFDDIVAA